MSTNISKSVKNYNNTLTILSLWIRNWYNYRQNNKNVWIFELSDTVLTYLISEYQHKTYIPFHFTNKTLYQTIKMNLWNHNITLSTKTKKYQSLYLNPQISLNDPSISFHWQFQIIKFTKSIQFG